MVGEWDNNEDVLRMANCILSIHFLFQLGDTRIPIEDFYMVENGLRTISLGSS